MVGSRNHTPGSRTGCASVEKYAAVAAQGVSRWQGQTRCAGSRFSGADMAAIAIRSPRHATADMYRQPQQPYTVGAPIAYSWAGPYIGANLGYQWGGVDSSNADPSVSTAAADRLLMADGQVRPASRPICNYSVRTIGSARGNSPIRGSALRGRAGVAFNNMLVYGTARSCLWLSVASRRHRFGRVKFGFGWTAGQPRNPA